MKRHRANLVVAIAGTVFVAATAGCGASHSGGEAVGTISVQLVTKGANGDTYQIPPTATLSLTSTTVAGAMPVNLAFDASTTQMSDTFSVPADTYTGQLSGGPSFQLVDLTTNQAVTASLLDMQPYNVAITTGQTTALTFHFDVPTIGAITFGTGTLQTNVAVSSTTGAPTTGNLGTTTTDISIVTTTSGFAPIQNLISQALPTVAGVGPTGGFKLGPWTPGVDKVCATATAQPWFLPYAVQLNPAQATGILSLINETMGPSGTTTLCLGDAAYGANLGISNPVVLEFTRTGPPTSPEVISALASYVGTPSFTFRIIGQATLPSTDPPPYDGTVASFSDFASSLTMTVVETSLIFDEGKADAVVARNDSTKPSTFTFQLTP
jgi:hypothetical protein